MAKFAYLSLLPALLGCGPLAGPHDRLDLSGRPIHVVTTIGMITDAVQHVGRERVMVEGLMGPGVDPHLYKASEGDVLRVADADVVFYGGLHLEGRMGKLFDRLQGRILAVAMTDRIPRDRLLEWEEEAEGEYDPHVWFDVSLWMLAVERVRDTLIEIDPTHAAIYQTNAARYLDELRELDRYVHNRAAEVPSEQRVLITAHDAFNYFGRAYGFEVRGLQGISTATETSTADVQDLARFIAERRIAALFVESSVPLRNLEAVQAAVRARGFRVDVGGELYSDAMGDPGTPDGSYVGMVRHNIDTIVDALKR
jgi:manganese/zinc/iron transport system substrate-binding protein